ncbi:MULTISPECIES: tyrosine-type recombinase/integrase [unclassified Rhizobium]|uniref:tyrosine-type recombinase/integrase n=1 Tax=unclassified Rhizobium TaxID=2613769 RepID=UPI003822ADDE
MGKRKAVLLTKRVVDAAHPDRERYHVWDNELSGFGVRVTPRGVKTFIIKYRADGGGRSAAQRILVIGRFGSITVEQARRIAKAKLGSVAAGEDPAEVLLARRRELTVKGLIDLYEKEGCIVQRGVRQGEPLKPATKNLVLGRLRNHVVALVGGRRAASLNPGDIERIVADVTAGKTARDEKTGYRRRSVVTGGAPAARKSAFDLSAVFNFGLRNGLVSQNPVKDAAIRRTDNRKTRFLNFDELARLGVALDKLETLGCNPKATTIIRLLALTGCRRNEISELEWSEVNFKDGRIELGDSKTGRSVRPLSEYAITILSTIKRGSSKFVFPAERGEGAYQGAPKVWAQVIAEAKISGATLHTLRHTVGSTAASSGEAMALTGAILGHSDLSSTAIYAHVQNDPSRDAANRVTKKIADALAGNATGELRAQQLANSPAPEELHVQLKKLVLQFLDQGADINSVLAVVTQAMADSISRKAVQKFA